MSGPAMFVRFGYPPNALGYCGPADAATVAELALSGDEGARELEHLIQAFQGAWPYLEMIATRARLSPLDERVVEAYWLGNSLLDTVDDLDWGNSLDDRFRDRAGWDWDGIETALNSGGVPNHAFHVFCVYPWVGLLRAGASEQALDVLDQCRIRWGRVIDVSDDAVLVESRPLTWDGAALHLGPKRVESVDAPIDDAGVALTPGIRVALHWNYVCQALTEEQLHGLRHNHARHLGIVNGTGARLARRVES